MEKLTKIITKLSNDNFFEELSTEQIERLAKQWNTAEDKQRKHELIKYHNGVYTFITNESIPPKYREYLLKQIFPEVILKPNDLLLLQVLEEDINLPVDC